MPYNLPQFQIRECKETQENQVVYELYIQLSVPRPIAELVRDSCNKGFIEAYEKAMSMPSELRITPMDTN